MKHIAVYMRVSTEDQSTGSQEQEIRKYLESRGLNPDNRLQVVWYIDKISGDKIYREALNRLRLRAGAGAVSEVVVWKLDRLSRSMIDGINLIHNWLESGIAVVSITQQFDFRGPIGKAVAALLLALAESELQGIRERVRAGIERARKNGKKWGGWQAGRARKIKQYGLLKNAEAMWLQGHSAPSIAKSLGVSRQHVYRLMKKRGFTEQSRMETRIRNQELNSAMIAAAKAPPKYKDKREREIIDKVADAILGPPQETPGEEPTDD